MMSAIPRRQIDEIIALHEREPSLREVVVEGQFDKNLLEWFLSESGLGDIPVLEISTIEVPTLLVIRRELEDGNRGRVIALAEELAVASAAREKVTCIVDADFDWLLNLSCDCCVLLRTDFACFEGYGFSARRIQKVMKLVLGRFHKNASTILQEVAGPLQELFLLRAANHITKLGLDFETPNNSGFHKSLRLVNSRFEFDANKYLTALLQAHGLGSKKAEVLAQVAELRKLMRSDPRYQINGHDFEQCLALYVRKHKGFGGTSSEVIVKSLAASIEMAELREFPFFQNLLNRTTCS